MTAKKRKNYEGTDRKKRKGGRQEGWMNGMDGPMGWINRCDGWIDGMGWMDRWMGWMGSDRPTD